LVTPDIGLALSGGGSRAAAFHLGCLRALSDRGLLPRVRVLSGISGGAVLGALYAYGPTQFADFDTQAVDLLRGGLHLAIARRLVFSRRLGQALLANLSLPPAALAEVAARRLGRTPAPRVRRVNRTTAFADVLAAQRFGETTMQQVTHPGLDVVLSACDLATGGAVRFGSAVSSCSRLGDLVDPVRVADAVAASAAFPAVLPALERRVAIRGRDGTVTDHVLLLTDGGVYDNLGTSVLEPGRDPTFTSHVYNVKYVIACDAGPGPGRVRTPHVWPTRMRRVVEIMHNRAQHGGRSALFTAKENGTLGGMVYVYLGMLDQRIPVPAAGLVPRSAVAGYPTNFAAMDNRSLTALTTRGEQLTRLLVSHYCPDL
jgi:NTE family protein